MLFRSEGQLEPGEASIALATAADIICAKLLTSILHDFAKEHGEPPGTYAVMAYGKWGSNELSIGSDLDLVAVYDADLDAKSIGQKPLSAPVYFMRVTQRLVTALTAPTGEGRLFEVDLRLRPSGAEGPLAAQFDSFKKYLSESAWTWELMALTRSRAAAGNDNLMLRLEELRAEVIRTAGLRPKLISDVIEMRKRISIEKGNGGVWDVKRRAGGMLDLEFLTQGLALVHGNMDEVINSRSPWEQASALKSVEPMFPSEALCEAAHFGIKSNGCCV